jgi:lipopolysaccharide heptosyltransferase II
VKGSPPLDADHADERVPASVLAVRLGAIGDVVNALVFAAALKEARPGVRIGWVVHPLAAALVEGHPCVDRVHQWKRGGGLVELARLVREIRAERYELAVDLQRIQKSALVARLSGAPRVLGYDRARAKELSWLWTKERIPPREQGRHMVLHYLDFARHLGAGSCAPRHSFPADPAAEAWAEERVRELEGEPVLVNVGATKPANRWIPARFGELAHGLSLDPGVPVCFTGGPGDRATADAARAAAGDARVRDLVGRTSLRQLVALTRRARLFVGCDTGPMHIAAALETPVVALFGPADPARTGPWGQAHRVVRVPPPCAPCNRRTCNQPRHACMEDISVERVLAVAREALLFPARSVGRES